MAAWTPKGNGKMGGTLKKSSSTSSSVGSHSDGDPFAQLDLNFVAKPFKRPQQQVAKRKAGGAKGKNFKQIMNLEKNLNLPMDVATYTNIVSPPSFVPQNKYCDVTGLEAPYRIKDRAVRYHDEQIYQYLKSVDQLTINVYLGLRNAAPNF